MAPSSPDASRMEVERTLKKLRDEPITTGSDDHVLGSIFNYLMSIGLDRDGKLHWFCLDADAVAREAAIFLLRLFAYSGQRVVIWKGKLTKCLHGCCACVKGFTEAKIASRDTYFGAFSEDVVRNFWLAFEKWEAETTIKALKDTGIESSPRKTLADVPPAIVYLMISTLQTLEEPEALSLIRTSPPPTRISEWPVDPPPPGLLLLIIHNTLEVRKWARSSLSGAQMISKAQFTRPYDVALEAIVLMLSTTDELSSERPVDKQHITRFTSIFSDSPAVIWSGLTTVLRLLPPEILSASKFKSGHTSLRQLILGHLHDNAAHFPDVLRCMVYLVKKLGNTVWEGENADYPQIVFDAIKDNPAFTNMLFTPEAMASDKPGPWFLMWFSEYFGTIWDMSIFGEVMSIIVGFMCEELQHERFGNTRPVVMAVAIRLLNLVARKAAKDKATRQYAALIAVLDVHGDMLVAVAFSRDYSKPPWAVARQLAQDLLRQIFVTDVDNLATMIAQLSNVLPPVQETIVLTTRPIRSQLWKKAYDNLQGNDSNGIAMMIAIASRVAHLDQLAKAAFTSNRLAPDTSASVREAFDTAVREVNHGLSGCRKGFLDVVSKFSNYNTSSIILELLQRPDMVKNIMALLLSPVEDLHIAAQTLVGQAFDVDVRVDCFRALLENLAASSLRGIMEFIELFNQYAPQIPEACSVSKSLVRCLTDVIEVLCNSPDGLLLSERYLLGTNGASSVPNGSDLAAELPKLWRLMTAAITVIFKRTVAWAAYFDNDTMVEWMRDALIFGRELLAQRRVFESAALTVSSKTIPTSGSPRKLSSIGKKMVDGLQSVLLELARWLRLTDEELLHQSFALLQSLLECFRETRVPPSPDAISKLTKFIDNGRMGKAAESRHTRLDSTRLSKLEDSLGSFEDDVIIISDNNSKPVVKKNDSDDDVIIISGPETKRTIKKEERIQEPPASSISKSITSASRPPTGPLTPTIEKDRKGIIGPSQSTSTVSSYFPQEATKEKAKGIDQGDIHPKPTKQPSAALLKNEGTDPKIGLSINRSSPADSSSNESDSDNDATEGDGLLSLTKLQRSPKKIAKPVERRQVKMMDVPNKGHSAIQARLDRREVARRTAMRLKPDITPLHRTILSWNYDHDGPTPPIVGPKPTLFRVPDRFTDHAEYLRVFEPLLMLECWSQITKAKEEIASDVYDCRISSRQFVDDWLDLDISINESVRKDWYLNETDIVLLRQSSGNKNIIGKALNFKNTHFGIQAEVRCYLGSSKNDPGLQTNTHWRICKVFSLSTLHREFAALMGLPYYDLFESILRPKLSRILSIDHKDVSRAMTAHQVNEPQAKAILSSMRTKGFSLIQGPPGTGKTWTICGLVGAFLSSRSKPATVVQVGRLSGSTEKTPPQKILICAPSNAAIDEVAKRLIEGVRDAHGNRIVPNVVRVGSDSSINISVRDISLDALVDRKIDSSETDAKTPKDASSEISVLRTELDFVKRMKQQKQEEMSQIHDNSSATLALEEDIKKLNAKRMELSQQFDRLKDKQKSTRRTLDAARRRFRQEVLFEADVICSTLSGAGHEILEQFDFEMVVIDEAAQSIELSSLIPLKYRCDRCIMVGDPQQLPPTVLSDASRWGYDQSLFVRIQKHQPEAAHLLSIQYRMHPDISQLPSRIFYNERLKDGPDMAKKTLQVWHSHSRFGVYKFFDVTRGREENSHVGHSLFNKAECQVTLALYDRLRREFSSIDFDYRVGIVSMYRAQVTELRRTFQGKYGADIVGKIDFNSVDGFQGQEKDIIILSCVRAGPGVQSVGFLADTRRMNVAITRSRSSLFIIGHASTLERSNETWKRILDDARSRSCLVEADAAYFRSATNAITPPKPQESPRTGRKSIKSRETVQTIPSGLSTPKGFKSHASPSKQALRDPQATSGSSTVENPIASSTPITAEPSIPASHVGQKRPNEEGAQHSSVKVRKINDASSAPPKPSIRPPIVKRPKKQPSLFIPKKNPSS